MSFLSELWPSRCLLCQITIPVCGCCLHCKHSLPWLPEVCPRCALPQAESLLCGRCRFKPPAFQRVIAAFAYAPPINAWITGIKFHERLLYVDFLAACLYEKLTVAYQATPWPQLLLPVPLHAKGLRQRGFNQAVELASSLARRTRLPWARCLLLKHRFTPPQMMLTKSARAINLKQAFTLRHALDCSHVALVDDVLTTGATSQEITVLLRQQGVSRVDIWCVARAYG